MFGPTTAGYPRAVDAVLRAALYNVGFMTCAWATPAHGLGAVLIILGLISLRLRLSKRWVTYDR